MEKKQSFNVFIFLKTLTLKISSFIIVFCLPAGLLLISIRRDFSIALTAGLVTVVFLTTFSQGSAALASNFQNHELKKLAKKLSFRLFKAASWLTLASIFIFLDFIYVTYMFNGSTLFLIPEYILILLSIPGYIFFGKYFLSSFSTLEDLIV